MPDSYKIIYKYDEQNYTIPINIPLLFYNITKKKWFQRKKFLEYPKNEQHKMGQEDAKLMAGQMGELLTQIYIWEKNHAKEFKSQMGNKERIKKIWLDTARKKIDPKGEDKPLLVKLTSSISSEFKKMTKRQNLEINKENRIIPEEGNKCCMDPGPMITGKLFYGNNKNGTWKRYQGIAIKREGRGLKGKIWGIACEGDPTAIPRPNPVWAEWNDRGGFAPTRTPETRTGFKKWWNWQLKNKKNKLLSIMPPEEKDKLPVAYKEDSNGPAPFNSIKGGRKKKSKKNIKMKKRKTRKGGSKILNALQKAKIINVIKDKKVQQYVKENKHKTFTLKKKLGGPKKFRSFSQKRKRKRKKKIKKKIATAKKSRRRKRRRKYTCRNRKNCK